jgi:hypothetical protein
VEARFHKRVQSDLDEIFFRYYKVSEELGEGFFSEFKAGLAKACRNPGFFHFDACGLRRCNLERFPYHFLYDIRDGTLRIWVLRHNQRRPSFGIRRFGR